MRIPIRIKLIVAISILMIAVFALAAYLFINEKKVEMADDIYGNSLTFARLTSPNIVDSYELYLAEDSFVYFNRELKSIFDQNDDISRIALISYSGEILYDSLKDISKKYEGEKRMVTEKPLLGQVQSENISLKDSIGRVVFMKKDLKDDFIYVDENENVVPAVDTGMLVDYLVVPTSEKYSVVYYVDYTNLNERVEGMMRRIIYLALFSVMLGMILSFVMSLHFTKSLNKLVFAANEIAKGDFSTRTNIKTRDEMNLLGRTFNKMAEDLEKSVEDKLYKERVTAELKLATQIQNQIVPKVIPPIKGLDLSAGLVPAEEIGGDIYDFIPLANDKAIMYLGDVTGHGVPAGIVSSISSALFYGYTAQSENLKDIIVNVNKVLNAKTMPNMFMTLCLLKWDGLSSACSYVSAGHEQIVHYKSKAGKASLCPSGGVALGMIDDISKHVEEQNIDFKVGDFLVIYSDGIPEMWRSKKENYGVDRLVSCVETCGKMSSSEDIKQAILKDVNEFAAGYKQMDDVTIIVIRRV